MKFIADFHIHSHYSIATSKNLKPEYLDYWGRLKGIKVIGTGDFTHPGWLKELSDKLEPAEQGIYKLRDEYKTEGKYRKDDEVRFVLTCEISSIYKKNDKVRKVHNVIFSPDFETAEHIQQQLSKIGNIAADGRPILGLDSRDLLEIALNASDNIFFVPAHIWTPWFSALGAKSGFDTIKECYDDLTEHIFAVETGLSSDPPMNYMCSFLDDYTLVSNSDAHSPEKLGREANIFNTDLSYNAIINALKTGNPDQFLGTIEFFPQEGKYHYDGHRKCGIVWNPLDTLKHKGKCPVCNKVVTVGVMNRVAQLSDREDITERKNQAPFYSLIPLKEILSEIFEVGPNTNKVTQAYNNLIQKFGSEFNILLNLSLDELKKGANDILAEAIRRMRNKEVFITEGYDGEYGQIKVFQEQEQKSKDSQASLFADMVRETRPEYLDKKMAHFDLNDYRQLIDVQKQAKKISKVKKQFVKEKTETNLLSGLNKEQYEAVTHHEGPALVMAGPGTGKTRVLTHRIVHLINELNVKSENILAVTFTNKAANEMKTRLKMLLSNKQMLSKLNISTFHALGYSILKEYPETCGRTENFTVIDERDKEYILRTELDCSVAQAKENSAFITQIKQDLKTEDEISDDKQSQLFENYIKILQHNNLFDLDDLIYQAVRLFKDDKNICTYYQNRYQWILIDEYQDINFAQYQMMKMLAPVANANLFVIGDPNQAIYGFRGADVRHINEFKNDYPEANIYKLKHSYRCSDFILRASSEVIKAEYKETHSLLEGLEEGVKINISQHGSDKSEAEFIARTIESLIGGLRFFSIDSDVARGETSAEINSLSDVVILCRINRQMSVLEKALNDHSIPYQKIDEYPYFDQEPNKSIIGILKLIVNPDNDYLRKYLVEKNILNSDKITEVANLHGLKPVVDIIQIIIEIFFKKEKTEKEEQLNKLQNLAHDYGDNLDGFLKFVTLGAAVDVYKPEIENVTLMTLHSAKGLEFKCVFIAGCEEGLIPYSLYGNQKPDLDEERRLLYVGMTRARKLLYLSYAKRRFILGKQYHLDKSPFLDSIQQDLFELSKSDYRRKEKREDDQLSLF